MSSMNWKQRVSLLVIIFWCLGGWYSFQELRYALSGANATGRVVEINEEVNHGRFGSEHHSLLVKYEFQDASGNNRSDSDRVQMDWSPPSDNLIPIRYIPGGGASRIASNIKVIALWMFGLASIGMGMMGWLFWREYAQHRQSMAAKA